MIRLFRPVWGLALAGACALLLSSGCGGVAPAVATFSNTTQPVTVGPVPHIGAKPRRKSGDPSSAFHVEAKNLYRYSAGSPTSGGTIHIQEEGPGKFDIEVLKALDGCRRCSIHIDELSVGSHAGVLIGISDDTHWTGADLELYRTRSARR